MDLIREFIENENRRSRKDGNIILRNRVLCSYGTHFPLMLHLGNYMLINADNRSVSTSGHQSACIHQAGARAVEIPFSAMSSAGVQVGLVTGSLDVFKACLEVLDKTGDKWETMKRWDEKQKKEVEYESHTLGASLIRYRSPPDPEHPVWNHGEKALVPPKHGFGKWRYFLSGVDETGVGRRGAYFLTELKRPAHTVQEAFEQLKPVEVREAEKAGRSVQRQGEYFFIEVDAPSVELEMRVRKIKPVKQFALPDADSGRSRHIATEGFVLKGRKAPLVRGTVRHALKEHRMIKLGAVWHTAWINIQKASFSAGGRFD